MNTLRSTDILRFFHSQYFLAGIRQTVGVLTPALVLGGLFQLYGIGAVASFGAACVAILDQPGAPRRYGTNGMLGAIGLGSLTAALTGLATGHPLALWLLVPGLSFFFSMFTVFGRQGGLLGFACLLLMTLTMRTPLAMHEVMAHTLYSFLGGLFYFVFSYYLRRLLRQRESRQALSVALFATADYVRARSAFYDMDVDLEQAWRDLVIRQADMTEKNQAARDLLLRELPGGQASDHHLRTATLNIFIDMVALLDNLIATQTDYARLREALGGSDTLIFSQDALAEMARQLEHIALEISRSRIRVRAKRAPARPLKVKAELRAIEYELKKYRQSGLQTERPEIYALLVQILRRLRNAARTIERMGEHERSTGSVALVDERLDKSFARFLSRQDFRWGLFTTNLRLDSPHFRYAVRVATATLLAMTLSLFLAESTLLEQALPEFQSHSYWIILTVLVIMKPGFALTRQRNILRLQGTMIGCVVALLLFHLTDDLDIYIGALIVASILGYSFIQLSYRLSSAFNTVFVLLVFQFLSAGGTGAIYERLFDTVVASLLALACSYILPWWERNFMVSLAQAAHRANRDFFLASLAYAQASQAHRQLTAPADSAASAPDAIDPAGQLHETDLRWRLARQHAYIAFSNLASAFYRMKDEPVRQQIHIPEFNHLLIQNHILASQITAATPVLASLDTIPPGIQDSLDAIALYLNDGDGDAPAVIETDGELASLAWPIRQMVSAARLIRDNMARLQDRTPVNATSVTA